MRELLTEDDIEVLLTKRVAVIFKHSTRCPISSAAHSEVENFAGSHPEIPVYLVRVIQNRQASDRVAARFSVAHESPQALVFRDGSLVWHGSHYDVTSAALEDWI